MGSGEHHFGVGVGQLAAGEAARCDAIARRHGAWFVAARMPEGWRHWFAAPNRGEPFDGATARAVLAEAGKVRRAVLTPEERAAETAAAGEERARVRRQLAAQRATEDRRAEWHRRRPGRD